MANYIQGIFGRSPFKPVQTHMDLCYRAAALIEDLLVRSCARDWDAVAKVREQIVDLETQADDSKRDIRMHLPRGFFLPVARGDLLDLLTRQDKIANKAKDIAGLVFGRSMSFPPEMLDSVSEFARASIAACKLALDAVGEFDDLIAAGFRGAQARRVESMISELDASETQSDDVQVKVRAQLRTLEQGLNPVDVIFLYRVLDRIGELADNAQRVGHRLEMMLAK